MTTPPNQFHFTIRAGSRRYVTINMKPNLGDFHLAAVAFHGNPVTAKGKKELGDPAIAYLNRASGDNPTEFSFQVSSPNPNKIFKIPVACTTNAPDEGDAATAEIIIVDVIITTVS